ncbi:hypothetical protein HYH03_002562 [Edaphochlamys debaryana]|uniref:Protein kinase domain-containing protein n=1 Tax=Edaphochlamys debaryana TaxID=47281 RepID=A0A835YBH7_9CHLO|nr:hypothetical protein HYH03_002562 [Edaphochlamys debaryana]|eukprot:KAG2499623.1 hypothetical protein HYH03_002562 [Edaphochlamys debaryana]
MAKEGSRTVLRTSYVTRVEGCAGPSSVQRLLFVTAGGAAAAQGVVRCISNFAEEVAPGGFLVTVEGYSSRNRGTSGPMQLPSISQLWFVWAVPVNATQPAPDPPLSETSFSGAAVLGQGLYGTGGVQVVVPRLAPVVPTPECTQARQLIPATQMPRDGPECGSSNAQGYACPSFMCCGTARGRVGLCGTVASSCLLSSCDPSYGLCGVVPSEALEVSIHEGILGVAPAPALAPTALVGGPVDDMPTSTVRLGRTVYSIDKLGAYSYSAAVDQCKSQRLFGLSWRILALEDAMAFEVSLLARMPFLFLLDNRVAWVRPSRSFPVNYTAPCLTVSWQVDEGNVQMVSVLATDCSVLSTVMCKADWPVLDLTNSDSSDTGSLPPPPPAPAPAPAFSSTPVSFRPGPHALSFSLIGIGNPNSGPNCTFHTVDAILDDHAMQFWRDVCVPAIDAASVVLPSSSAMTEADPVPMGMNATLSRTIAGLALRPLLTWSAVASEPPSSYEALGSLALQYTSPSEDLYDTKRALSGLDDAPTSPQRRTPPPPAAILTDAPLILGSQDGTYLSENASYGATAPPASIAATAELTSYLSSAAGWRGIQFEAASGEVIVEVAGCRGAQVEELVFRTNTGRRWATPAGLGLVCSVPFRFAAPSGGYLVALQVHAGHYVEEVTLIWGAPILPPSPPPAAPNGVSSLATISGGSSHRGPAAGVLAAAVTASVTGVLVLLVGAWWARKRGLPCVAGRDASGKRVASAAEAAPSTDGGDGGSPSAPAAGPDAQLELSCVVVDGASQPHGGARGKASPATSASDSTASDTAIGGAATAGTTVTSTHPLSHGGGSSERRGPYHAIAATLATGLGTSTVPSAEDDSTAHVVAAALITSGEANSATSGAVSRPQPPPPTLEGSSGSAAKAAATLAAAAALADQARGQAHSAWAQSLHDALFHKVLYWQTPVSSVHRPGQGLPLAASTAGLATPLAAPTAALHLLSEAGGQGAGPVLSPASSGARQPALTTPAPAQQRGRSSVSAEGALVSASGESRPAPSAGSGATGAGAAAANGVGAGSSGGAAGPQRSGGGSGSAAGGAGSEARAVAGPAGSGSGGALARTVSPPASQAAANAAGGAGRGSGGSGGAGGSGTAPGSGAAAASPALVGPSAAAAPPAGPAAAVAGLGRELPPRPMPPVVPGPSGTAVHTAATGVKVLSGPSEAAELLLGRDVVVDLEDPSTYLGHGTSGVVRRGLLRTEEGGWMQVAVKLLNRPNDQAVDTYRRHLKTLLQEITILGSLCHPNVVRLLGGSVSLASGESFLVEELCGSTLSHAIYDEATPYSLASVLRWCTDIARGLAYLHPK